MLARQNAYYTQNKNISVHSDEIRVEAFLMTCHCSTISVDSISPLMKK